MGSFVQFVRKTASRVYKRKGDENGELHPLHETCNKWSSSCFNLYQACIIGDVDAVRWYINVGHKDVNQPDTNGCTALFYTIQKNNVVLVKDLVNAGVDVNKMATLEEGIMVTPVHIAAKYNRCECLKILLENGADANIGNSFGQTALHNAARRKLNEMVKILIKQGKANVNHADHDMVTALHMAATPGNDGERAAVVNTLLVNGANPFSEDNEGNTAFHEAAENGVDDVLEIFCEYKDYDSGCCSSIADVLNKPRKDGFNCLHLAVKYDHEKVIRLCIDHKADIDRKSTHGDTPLHIACCRDSTNAVNILLENGANISIKDSEDRVFLHRAAIRGSISTCALLLEKGADIDAYNVCGSALLHASFNRQHAVVKFLLEKGATPTMRNRMLDTCLHVAVKNGDVETVKVIVENCGCQLLNLKDKFENTTLHLAARTGNEEVLKILLSFNPNMRAIDDRGKCPIHIAAENGQTECVKLLVQSDKCSVHVTDFMWRTPLHLACLSGNDLDIVKFLLESGADPNARDDRRWTPLLYVAAKGCPCCTSLLVQFGAKINEWDKNRMTALSVAAKSNQHFAVEKLLEIGADPSILTCDGLNCMDIALNNRFHDVCMVIAKSDKWREALVSTTTMESCLEISPDVAKVILDRCIEYSGREVDKDYKVTYNFELLDSHPELHEDYYGPLTMKVARRYELLTHPLTKQLIETNWKSGVRYIYYAQMFFLALALVSLTIFLLWTKTVIEECYDAIKDEYDQVDKNSSFYKNDEDFCLQVFQAKGYEGYTFDENRMTFLRYFVFVYFLCYLGKELKQLKQERWEYFLELTNYLDLAVSLLFLNFVEWPGGKPIPFCRLKFGIVGIFAYYFLVFLWTRGLTRCGIYITMFLEVLETLVKVVSAFVLLFVCFSVTFYMVFTTKETEEFSDFFDAVLKVIAMVMGELDYSGLRQKSCSLTQDMQDIAIIVFVIFCITMSLVVNNLLIGLAVGDIEAVRKNAEIKLLSLQVNEILQARAKMVIARFRAKFYIKSVTKMPNKHDRKAEQRQKELMLRNQHRDGKKKTELVCA
ncbi:serine/threonine-protein phosphatase 6 regulatory ankyrin repeat subunit B-like [Dendronephthya gigantea]|uniref:serine/threonine-protein phosphatase 6 regulatory ankyrin repeat subunit B-like n=1 Tax=Dendronephthya gigantea TaxID=151771 RepID=UPI00106B92E4|nr:serine/threonine-protein phosphatase 6 regulatory ankyrin repeat subunit B-like [Dendronephthya gigantea]